MAVPVLHREVEEPETLKTEAVVVRWEAEALPEMDITERVVAAAGITAAEAAAEVDIAIAVQAAAAAVPAGRPEAIQLITPDIKTATEA